MAHFYGSVQGQAGEATRIGSKGSGERAYVQGWGTRLAVNMHYNEREECDAGYITITGGPSSGAGSHSLSLPDADKMLAALDTPEGRKIWQRIEKDFRKLADQAPTLVARQERRRVREQRKREREETERQQQLETWRGSEAFETFKETMRERANALIAEESKERDFEGNIPTWFIASRLAEDMMNACPVYTNKYYWEDEAREIVDEVTEVPA